MRLSATDNGASFKTVGVNALIVDDNPVNLNVAAGFFKSLGIEADLASSGIEALELVPGNCYDLVFMDQMMPGMDGIETTRKLRQMGFTAEKLPIIALSSNNDEGARDMFIKNGMQDFLNKPIDKSKLCSMLAKWLPPEKIVDPGREKEEALDKVMLLRRVDGLDLAACLDDANFDAVRYLKSVDVFVRNMPLILGSLSRVNEGPKLEGLFRSISTLAGNIGAFSLSAEAEVFERLAAESDGTGNIEVAPLIEKLSALRDRIFMAVG